MIDCHVHYPCKVKNAIIIPNKSNNYAAECKIVLESSKMCFGRLHPERNDIDDLRILYEMGIKGLKLNSVSDNFNLLSENSLKIINKCAELNLPLLIHSDEAKATPDEFEKLAKKTNAKIIIAHAGKCRSAEIKDLLRKYENLYADTSLISLYRLNNLLEVADKLCFGSDTPYSHFKIEKMKVELSAATPKEKKMIFSENILKLIK